ncbi:guanine-1-methyltransferase-domain-containing protein [Diplogelasinospora grovesii]|uniref:tRNA (guanine(9)-N1)-methyltransferase n=1 Tax=Diplogelasinospora grovesii TaxID=303347 RepID=A0AAN6NA75_9PEZI|nr:guanine-1-methyltransferase-domain-containing protein [Diplogelasinospora grovesii]
MAADETSTVPQDVQMDDTTLAPSATSSNGKRKAEDELDREDNTPQGDDQQDGAGLGEDGQPLTKNQLKRLRRQQAYAQFKEDRKARRKEKRHDKQARKRAEKEAAVAAGLDPSQVRPKAEPWKPNPVPVAFIIDCDFESYMREPEIVSLSSQVTRSYSENRKSKNQAHLFVSGWKGKLKERFETVLKNTHEKWKNVHILEGDFVEAARQAGEVMKSPAGGEMIEVLKPQEIQKEETESGDGKPQPEPEEEGVDRSVVYLTSESPYTLERLEANTSYVIGGIVDRNREKGLCYKRAREHKVRTAKLPIGEYMAMQSRYVLTTNQVVEIMAKWLDCGDWGEAFMSVIPKRKGGTLKGPGSSVAGSTNGDEQEDGQDEEEGEPSEDIPQPTAISSEPVPES